MIVILRNLSSVKDNRRVFAQLEYLKELEKQKQESINRSWAQKLRHYNSVK